MAPKQRKGGGKGKGKGKGDPGHGVGEEEEAEGKGQGKGKGDGLDEGGKQLRKESAAPQHHLQKNKGAWLLHGQKSNAF